MLQTTWFNPLCVSYYRTSHHQTKTPHRSSSNWHQIKPCCFFFCLFVCFFSHKDDNTFKVRETSVVIIITFFWYYNLILLPKSRTILPPMSSWWLIDQKLINDWSSIHGCHKSLDATCSCYYGTRGGHSNVKGGIRLVQKFT